MDNKQNIDGLRPWHKGDELAAKHLDETRQVLSKQGVLAPGSQVLNPRIPQMSCQLFRILGVEDDYLTCYVADSNGTSEEIVHVAMPYILQQTHYATRDADRKGLSYVYDDPIAAEPNTVRRTATNEDDEEEIQVIVPSYEVDDIIIGFTGISGGTNVADADGTPVIWMDLNIDGRMWAKDADPPE